MPDDFDHASAIEELYRELVIAAGTRPLQPHVESLQFCADESCGVEIPQARRDAVPGCRFCIECQTRREKRQRLKYAIHP
ncbi:TraR/DksA C4-type zinc finger protein [Paraburkholderia unamae]|uniref:TraR/DksA C4-type zinc finger protein n=1 Tax=Paraburkholderia unamae TaxID=219649 RepID=UPI000E304B8C|nr:TraR/DksA C4-type zinc finger protein [Paraburkholderia unamae]